MRDLARVIKTAVGGIAGGICGAFLGSFGLFALLSLIDWARDAGPGNQISGGAWPLAFFTAPIGALVLSVACGNATWKSYDESKCEDRSESRDAEERQTDSDEML